MGGKGGKRKAGVRKELQRKMGNLVKESRGEFKERRQRKQEKEKDRKSENKNGNAKKKGKEI